MKWHDDNLIPSISKQINNHNYKEKISRYSPKLQSERHNRLEKKLIINLTVFITIILIMIYFISPLSKVSSIKIDSQNRASIDLIKRNLKISKGDSIFKFIYNRKLIRKRIYNNDPYVRSVDLKISGINQVKIKSDEFKLIGYKMLKNHYYPILSSGGIDNSYDISKYDNTLPVFINFNSSQSLHKLIEQYQMLSVALKKDIKRIEYLPNSADNMRVCLIMRDGNKIYAKIDTLAQKMPYYFSILKTLKKPSVINMEVGVYSYPQK